MVVRSERGLNGAEAVEGIYARHHAQKLVTAEPNDEVIYSDRSPDRLHLTMISRRYFAAGDRDPSTGPRSDRRNDARHHYRSAPARESVAAMDGRRARQRVWPEWFDSDVAAPPPLDIAAV
jgi:hypothetical protein